MITLAADFGGQRIKLGLVRDGNVVVTRVVPAQADLPLEKRLTGIARELKELCAQAAIQPSQCAGVGFAYPSIIDTRESRILDHFGKFGDARDLDLNLWARRAFGLPLAIDNDARMALIGEWRYGAGKGCDNLAIMTLGTGLGTSAIIEGRLLRGAHGQAGILGGHVTINWHGRACVCGNIGCAESEASTWALRELAATLPDLNTSSLSAETDLDYSAIFRLAEQGDRCARALRDHSLKVWGVTAVNLVHVYDPERIILGGGIMRSAASIIPPVQEWIRRYAHTPWGNVQVVASQLGDQAALLACEWLVATCCEQETRANP
jgi:glucokinase